MGRYAVTVIRTITLKVSAEQKLRANQVGDRDVRLRVLEPVPVGEPVTWCHRMVICDKKNGLSIT